MDRRVKRRKRPVRLGPAALDAADPSAAFVSVEISPPAVLERLCLANAVLTELRYVLDPVFLNEVFQNYRGRSFEQQISFATMVHLIGDALLQHEGSARQSFERAEEIAPLPASVEACYRKLGRIPLSLSVGFVECASQRLLELFPTGVAAVQLPRCLDGMTPVVIDGKAIKKVAKRLKATRGTLGKLSGGKLLVAVLPATSLVLTMAADLDGETNEAKLIPELLPRLHALVKTPVLHIADRQHGDPAQIQRYTEGGHHVLVRWDGSATFEVDPERPAVHGTDNKGRPVIQEWGWLGAKSNKCRRYVRRITLIRPGKTVEDVILLTDLLDEAAYPATDLLDVYLMRWGIERVFQQITEVFSLKRLIGSTARAAVFQAAFCLVLYNLIQVVRGWIAAGRECLTEQISTEQLFYDTRRQLGGLYELIEPAKVIACFESSFTREQVIERLRSKLCGLWRNRWRKTCNKKPRPPKEKAPPCFGAHNSVHRVVLAYQAKQGGQTRRA
jgi:hypothetical protein